MSTSQVDRMSAKQGCLPIGLAHRVPFPEERCGHTGCILSLLLQERFGAGGLVMWAEQ